MFVLHHNAIGLQAFEEFMANLRDDEEYQVMQQLTLAYMCDTHPGCFKAIVKQADSLIATGPRACASCNWGICGEEPHCPRCGADQHEVCVPQQGVCAVCGGFCGVMHCMYHLEENT